MKKKQFYYIIHLQYLGFRFHGWAKQPPLKTVHMMVDKTLSFALGHHNFKTLVASRTDAMVSANHALFELFVEQEIDDDFLAVFNSNAPTDIRAIKVETTDSSFNIIQSPKSKEYLYLFASGEKMHPFTAPFLTSFMESLHVDLMKAGAELFKGQHNFRKYCTAPSPKTQFVRTLEVSEIVPNDIYTANFFPKESYVYRVVSKGFMRNQVRLMMGQLILLGKGQLTLKDIENSLIDPDEKHLNYIAPASGLILNSIEFD